MVHVRDSATSRNAQGPKSKPAFYGPVTGHVVIFAPLNVRFSGVGELLVLPGCVTDTRTGIDQLSLMTPILGEDNIQEVSTVL
jgi:hypothetical protein